MPKVGFGTWNIPNTPEGVAAVARAIKMGYRHIDGATAYQNQQTVGDGIKLALREEPTIRREDLWVTSKIWATSHKEPRQGMQANLDQLKLNYIDLTLVHFPVGNTQQPKRHSNGDIVRDRDGNQVNETIAEYDFIHMWRKLEELVDERKTRHIGISNFNTTQIEELLRHARIKPYTHQIESHPYLQDWKFFDFHRQKDIHITAYAPLGNTNPDYHYRNWKSAGRLMINDPVLKKIASEHGSCTPAQIALAFNLHRNITVIPKAVNVIHQVENYEAHQKCKLSDRDVERIRDLDRNGRGGKRYWDMCCAMQLPCYLGLQDAPETTPAPADYCQMEGAWAPSFSKYNRERSDLWLPAKKNQNERPLWD